MTRTQMIVSWPKLSDRAARVGDPDGDVLFEPGIELPIDELTVDGHLPDAPD